MRLPGRTLATLVAALAAGVALFVWWTDAHLLPRLEARARDELAREARLVVEALGGRAFSDSLADRMGEATGLRVTLIRPDGSVAGDSEVPGDRIAGIESHAQRPEVRAALAGRAGFDRRASRTVSRELLYAALPHPQGAVRLARPFAGVAEEAARVREAALAGGFLILLFGLAAALVLGAAEARAVRRIETAVRAIAGGALGARVRGGGRPGLARLGAAVDEMAVAIESDVLRLRAEKTDFESMFERLEDGVAAIDREGRVARANLAFRGWVGRQDVAGERFANLFRDPHVVHAVERALAGESASHEATLGDRTLLLSARPHGGGALVALRDLTRLRQLEGVRRDFVANVSHELKTPLTGVIGFAEAVAEGDLPPERAAEFGRRILANADRMRSLLDDLLDLARIESGAWRPRSEPLDPAAEAREAWASLQPLPERGGVRLACEEPAHRVLADPEALRQVFRNLLDNALRYAPRASAVRVATRRENGGVRIEVSDLGPGIPAAHRERVFERFYRIDTARSREAGGTGLGLSIVKHLVLAHGGRIGIVSELGEGTTVWFVLPAAE